MDVAGSDRLLEFSAAKLCKGLALVGVIALAGCGSLPSGAPTVREVAAEVEDNPGGNIASVNASLAVLRKLKPFDADDAGETGFFADNGARVTTLGPGDVLSITVIEQVTGGLFSASSDTAAKHGSNLVTLPEVQIDAKGMISLPYLGEVRAGGMTEQSLSKLLLEQLASQTPTPGVLVRRTQNLSNMVLVGGVVRTPGTVQLTPSGETLMEVIARAGGSLSAPNDTLVKLTRGGETRSIRLSALQDRPKFNLRMQRGDAVTLESSPQYYTVLGAASSEASLPLPGSGVTLAEVIGQVGGLNDARADNKGVYVLRYERRDVLRALGVVPSPGTNECCVPTVYQFNLGSVDGLFAAQGYQVRSRDIVLIANAGGVELTKAFRLLTGATLPVEKATSVARRF